MMGGVIVNMSKTDKEIVFKKIFSNEQSSEDLLLKVYELIFEEINNNK